MTVAVASGKGGTGKTTVAVALVLSYDRNSVLLDCDVEEPNAGFFLRSKSIKKEEFSVPVPVIDAAKCNLCGRCADFCSFNALALAGSKILVFRDLCHSCGGCSLICPQNAVMEEKNIIGEIHSAESDKIFFVEGTLKIGKAMSPPLIREVKKYGKGENLTVIDCPPGNSCPMITAVRGADYVVLVTEPTPFGRHDLSLAAETVSEMKIPLGVILNRYGSGYKGVEEFCEKRGIEIILKIDEDIKIAQAQSEGKTILDVCPEMKDKMCGIVDKIQKGLTK
ncbi:ATP-binding protein [candidate division WOR-3 bacterium]|nr:ATP-binding protein [candidate division WOR-3 bacterium]